MKYNWLFILSFLLQACIVNHNSFTVKPSKKTKNNLTPGFRTDGVYYRFDSRDYHDYLGRYINSSYSLQYFIPYNNGVMINVVMGRDKSYPQSRDSLITLINDYNIQMSQKKNRAAHEYGGYAITGDSIVFQTIRIYHWGSFYVSHHVGKINTEDETIRVSRRAVLHKNEKPYTNNIEVNESYKFLPAVKIDSMNIRWVNKKWFWAG